ncbi:MAG: VanZ family protein [Gemmatimonadaceae bacterium]
MISLTIELLQWRLIPGRDAALGDLIANSLGGAIGAAVVRWAAALFLPNTRQARRLAALGAALAAVVLTGVGSLLTPAVPYLVHWVQWLPRKNGYDTFARLARFAPGQRTGAGRVRCGGPGLSPARCS